MTVNTHNKENTVSVVIPAYNIAGYVGAAVQSALKQTRPAREIIVVDDGSIDGTAGIVQSFGDRVRYLYQANRGLSGARNTGIRAATGEWIALLDGDDEWLPDKLEKQLACLEANPDLVWCCCNHIIHNMATAQRQLMQPVAYCDGLLDGKRYFESFFLANLSHIWWPPSTMIIRRSVFEQAGLFREGLRFAEDIEMWWRIAYRRSPIGFVSEPLIVYNQFRPESLTAATAEDEKIRIMCDMYDDHLQLSRQFGCYEGVSGFVDHNLRRFISSYYLAGQPAKIPPLLRRYKRVLPWKYRWAMAAFMRLIPPGSTVSTTYLNKITYQNWVWGYDRED